MSETTLTTCGATEVANRVGITLRQLYYWERLGVVTPRRETFGDRQFRRYTERDIRVLREVKRLVDEGYVLSRAAEKVLAGERGTGDA